MRRSISASSRALGLSRSRAAAPASAQLMTTRRSFATDDAQREAHEKAVKEGKLIFTLACPHETLINAEPVKIATVPSATGDMGILAHHVPTIAQLKPGVVKVTKFDESGATRDADYFISGGFVTVYPDSHCNVNVVEAFPLDQLDPEKARKGLDDFTKELATATDNEAKTVAQIGVELYKAMCSALKCKQSGTTRIMLRKFTDDDEDFMTWVDPDQQQQQEGLEDEHTTALTVHQKISNLVNRWLHSRGCSFFYVGMILLNLLLIGWVVAARGYPKHWLFVTLEVFINVVLVVEVSFKLIAQKRRFFVSKSNWFDLAVTVLCVVSLGVYFGGPSTMEEIDDALAIFLLILRYGVQFLRLVLFVKNNQRKLLSSSTNVILLDSDGDEEIARQAVDHGSSAIVTTDDAHAQSFIYNDSDDDDDDYDNSGASRDSKASKFRFASLGK